MARAELVRDYRHTEEMMDSGVGRVSAGLWAGVCGRWTSATHSAVGRSVGRSGRCVPVTLLRLRYVSVVSAFCARSGSRLCMVLCILRSLGLMLLHVRLLWWLYVFLHPAVDWVNAVTGREVVLGVAGLGPVLCWGCGR